MAVRFGNVLGSNGSACSRGSSQQIKSGGPVTVTHPEMRRYFMLIPEAVQLVLHAAAHGEQGIAYVLEMGEQIKLVDMARNLIRLSGFVPDEEIPISFIGLRPGEKLSESLISEDELIEPSSVAKVLRVRNRKSDAAAVITPQMIRSFERAASRGDSREVLELIATMVPRFRAAAESWQCRSVAAGSVVVNRLNQSLAS